MLLDVQGPLKWDTMVFELKIEYNVTTQKIPGI